MIRAPAFALGLILAASSAHAQTPVHSSNINNAPAWASSHVYSLPQEVYTSGGSGVTGTRGYKLLTTSCTSASSGGPSGTGSSITDGTCAWKYLSDIDYTSISLWLQNGIPPWIAAPSWAQSTGYLLYDVVVSNSQAWSVISAGTSCGTGAGPSGGTLNSTFTDCGVTWAFINNYLPTTVPPNAITQERGQYVGVAYNGGEYLDDGLTIGSSADIVFTGHNGLCNPPGTTNECFSLDYYLPTLEASSILLTVAPGESVFDGANPAVYDPTKGVAIRCSGNLDACLVMGEWNIFVSRIQLQTPGNGVAFYTHGAISDSLIDVGHDGLFLDAETTLANSIIYAGNVGVGVKYNPTVINNTILGKTGAVVGIAQLDNANYVGAPEINNNVVMGFAYCATYQPSATFGFESAAPPSDYNATDVGSGGAQNGTTVITWTGGNSGNSIGQPATSIPCPGSHSAYNVAFNSGTIVNATSGSYDARLVSGSPLRGIGGLIATTLSVGSATTYGTGFSQGNLVNAGGNPVCTPTRSPYNNPFDPEFCGNPLATISGGGFPTSDTIISVVAGLIASQPCASGCGTGSTITIDWGPLQAKDIFGTIRPQGSAYDPGAAQFAGAAPPPTPVGPGMRHR